MLDFRSLNSQLNTLDVIRLLRLSGRCEGDGNWRGHCPLHENTKRHRRYLSVGIPERHWTCHRCKRCGDLIDLYALVCKVSLVHAARALADAFGIDAERGRGTVDSTE